MLQYLIYYIIGCLGCMVFNVTVQVVTRKNLMSNWVYINDMTGELKDMQLNAFPPIDGWPMTILFCFIPLLNLFYTWFICMLALKNTESNLIISYQMAARELKREGKWKK